MKIIEIYNAYCNAARHGSGTSYVSDRLPSEKVNERHHDSINESGEMNYQI